jgi:HAD superfamily hydrolase (TIGR01490 family)
MKACAFFDLDHTIIKGNSGFLYTDALRQHGLIKPIDFIKSIWWAIEHRVGVLNSEEFIKTVLAWGKGRPEEETIMICNWIFQRHLKGQIFKEALDLIRKHKEAGEEPIILSAASNYVVEPVSKYIGLDRFICTRLKTKNGRFTGELDGGHCYGEGKLKRLREFVEKAGVDLSKSFLYADSLSDVPVLEIVGHPVVVNPSFRMAHLAKKRAWPILYFKTFDPSFREQGIRQ